VSEEQLLDSFAIYLVHPMWLRSNETLHIANAHLDLAPAIEETSLARRAI
jgi:hypothetical protein